MNESIKSTDSDPAKHWKQLVRLCDALLDEIAPLVEIDAPNTGEYPALGVNKIQSLRRRYWEEALCDSEAALRERLTKEQWPRLSSVSAFWIQERLRWAQQFSKRIANSATASESCAIPSFPPGTRLFEAALWLLIDLYESAPDLPVHWHDQIHFDWY